MDELGTSNQFFDAPRGDIQVCNQLSKRHGMLPFSRGEMKPLASAMGMNGRPPVFKKMYTSRKPELFPVRS